MWALPAWWSVRDAMAQAPAPVIPAGTGHQATGTGQSGPLGFLARVILGATYKVEVTRLLPCASVGPAAWRVEHEHKHKPAPVAPGRVLRAPTVCTVTRGSLLVAGSERCAAGSPGTHCDPWVAWS